MSTNNPTPENDSGGVPVPIRHDAAVVEAVIAGCHARLDAVETPTTYPFARTITEYCDHDSQIIGHVLTALADHHEAVVAQLGYEPDLEVEVWTRGNCNSGRYRITRRALADGGENHCSECGAVLPDEIEDGTGVYCSHCGTGQLVTDGGLDPLADVEGLSCVETAVLLAVRLAGPVTQAEIHRRGVASGGATSVAVRTLLDAELLASVETFGLGQTRLLYDPVRHEKPQPRVVPDGGEEIAYACEVCPFVTTDREAAIDHGVDEGHRVRHHRSGAIMTDGGTAIHPGRPSVATVEMGVTISASQTNALDHLVEEGVYLSRSAGIRSALRRELRLQSRNRDTTAQRLQDLYTFIQRGKRPEAIAQCERLAETLGVELDREVGR